MRVAIHPNMRKMLLSYSSHRDIDILKYNGIDFIILDVNSNSFWQDVKTCDRFIFRWNQYDYPSQIAKNILPIIEKDLGIKCFPSVNCCWAYDNKIREYYLLTQYGFPTPECWIFYDKLKALKFIQTADYPLIFKLKGGAGARSVLKLKNKHEGEKLVRLMFGRGVSNKLNLPGTFRRDIKDRGIVSVLRKRGGEIKNRLKEGQAYFDRDWQINKNYALFQEFLPDNLYDTRVVTIGNRAFAFQRLNRPKDFRASGSLQASFEPEKIDKQFIQIAFAISQKLGFETMAYDFLYDRNKNPVVVEFSYAFGADKGSKISLCPGYWDASLNWYPGHWEPEYLQMMDFLEWEDLKKPTSVKNPPKPALVAFL